MGMEGREEGKRGGAMVFVFVGAGENRKGVAK